MMRKILFFIFLTVIFSSFCFAETLKLKNGRTVEGKIIEKTDEYVLFEVSGVAIKYYADEIENTAEIGLTMPQDDSAGKTGREIYTITKIAGKQIFKDEIWRYSFEYPADWQILPKDKTLEGFNVALRPQVSEDLPEVTVNIQRGRISDTYLRDDLTPEKLLESLIKFSAYTEHQPAEAVSFSHVSGYKIKAFKRKTIVLTDVKELEDGLEAAYRVTDDYYFFSPSFAGDKNDNRFFVIVVAYTLYSEVDSDRPNIKDNEILHKFNSQFKLKNQKTEESLKQARQILNSFNYSSTPSISAVKETITGFGAATLPKPDELMQIMPARLPVGKLQELQEYLQKGTKFLMDKQYREAIPELEKALNINPTHAAVLYYLGRAYFSLGDTERAMGYYQKVLQVVPNYPDVYVDMGLLYAGLGRFEEAIRYYEKAIELNPDNIMAYNSLAFAYTSLGKYREATDNFKKSIKVRADNAEAYVGLGLLYSSSGQYQEAKENFRQAREILQAKGDTQALKTIDDYLKGLPQ